MHLKMWNIVFLSLQPNSGYQAEHISQDFFKTCYDILGITVHILWEKQT
jgi:hypothetical protein